MVHALSFNLFISYLTDLSLSQEVLAPLVQVSHLSVQIRKSYPMHYTLAFAF